jgi:hypothetical protein
MDDWPELEDASNFRELRNQQSLSDFEARLFVDRLEKKVAERAALLERLDPWKKTGSAAAGSGQAVGAAGLFKSAADVRCLLAAWSRAHGSTASHF